jgi:hypothetical protein
MFMKRIKVKIGLILILSVLIASCGYEKDQEYLRRRDEYMKKVTEILSGNANEYKVIRQKEEWNKLVLKRGNKTIYEITPVYFLDVPNDDVQIKPIYDDLVDRYLYKEVLPFDDITGDGIPNLVIREYPSLSQWNNYMPPFVVRILSINQDSVTEFEPIAEGGGEIYYFADFNNDGVLEFVNTDWEGDFVYNDDGIPLSDYVWILDAKQKKYLKTSYMK